MGTTFCQEPMVQDHKMANVVCEQNPSLARRVGQDCRIIKPLLSNIVHAQGIDPMPMQLRGEVGIHILVNEEGYADCPCIPCL